MKILSLTAFLLLGATLTAQEPNPVSSANAYDLLGKTLAPIARLFTSQPGESARALSLTLALESFNRLKPEQLGGATVEIDIQPPDRARLRLRWNGQVWAAGRNGQEIWVDAGMPLETLPIPPIPQSGATGGSLPPLALPFPPQQLNFLPILFQVTDQGTYDGKRVLDLRLMPELARGLKAEGWAARITLDRGETPDTPKLTRLELAGPQWGGAARVETCRFSAGLPETHWEPTPGAIRLNAGQAREWLTQIFRGR